VSQQENHCGTAVSRLEAISVARLVCGGADDTWQQVDASRQLMMGQRLSGGGSRKTR